MTLGVSFRFLFVIITISFCLVLFKITLMIMFYKYMYCIEVGEVEGLRKVDSILLLFYN